MKKSFALVYTVLFVALLLITVATTWATGMADIRLARTDESSYEAYLLARSAIDDGFGRYKTVVGSTATLNQTFPANACTVSKVLRVDPNAVTTTGDTVDLSKPVTLAEQLKGMYDLRYCSNASITTIDGVGYYKGNKITLRATVNHDDDVVIVDQTIGLPTGEINHSKDYLKIEQTGTLK